jgi:hypothetical protein
MSMTDLFSSLHSLVNWFQERGLPADKIVIRLPDADTGLAFANYVQQELAPYDPIPVIGPKVALVELLGVCFTWPVPDA